MSLLWRTAMIRTATWEPHDSEEHMHPSELEGGYYPHGGDVSYLTHRDVFGDGSHVRKMAEDIKAHGYDPAKHGQLGLNLTDHGENIYNHATGSMAHPSVPHFNHEHLLQALKDSGHGEVPVHVHDQRSIENGDQAPRYYHGTTEEDLEEVHPNHGTGGNFGKFIHEPGYAYATGKDSAWHYAVRAADAYGGTPHVYEVAPKGPVEEDPISDAHGNLRGNFHDDMRSKHGFQVVGEEEMPEHLRHFYNEDEDDDDDWDNEDHEHEDW